MPGTGAVSPCLCPLPFRASHLGPVFWGLGDPEQQLGLLTRTSREGCVSQVLGMHGRDLPTFSKCFFRVMKEMAIVVKMQAAQPWVEFTGWTHCRAPHPPPCSCQFLPSPPLRGGALDPWLFCDSLAPAAGAPCAASVPRASVSDGLVVPRAGAFHEAARSSACPRARDRLLPTVPSCVLWRAPGGSEDRNPAHAARLQVLEESSSPRLPAGPCLASMGRWTLGSPSSLSPRVASAVALDWQLRNAEKLLQGRVRLLFKRDKE